MRRRDETMTSKGTAGFSLMRSHEIETRVAASSSIRTLANNYLNSASGSNEQRGFCSQTK